MTDKEILAELGTTSLLNRVRLALTSHEGAMAQADAQRHKPDVFELRRMEFRTAAQIIELVRSHEAHTGAPGNSVATRDDDRTP